MNPIAFFMMVDFYKKMFWMVPDFTPTVKPLGEEKDDS